MTVLRQRENVDGVVAARSLDFGELRRKLRHLQVVKMGIEASESAGFVGLYFLMSP